MELALIFGSGLELSAWIGGGLAALTAVLQATKLFLENRKLHYENQKLKREREDAITLHALQDGEQASKAQEFNKYEERYLAVISRETGIVDNGACHRLDGQGWTLDSVFIGLTGSIHSSTDVHTSSQIIGNLASASDDDTALVQELMRTKHAVILGEHGCGKSTLLQYIANACCREPQLRYKLIGTAQPLIPVLVPLRRLPVLISSDAVTPEKLIEAIENQILRSIYPEGYFSDVLKRGKGLLLFDGLDEIISDNDRGKVAKWLDQLLSVYAENYFIVTSRPAAFRRTPLHKLSTEIRINPLDQGQISRLVRRMWQASRVTSQVTSSATLLRIIRRNSVLYKMAQSPFLLSLLVLLGIRDSLPDSGPDMYRKILYQLFLRDKDRDIALPEVAQNPGRVGAFLSAIAYRILSTGGGGISRSDVIAVLTDVDKKMTETEASELTAVLCDRTGLLLEVDGTIDFVNQFFRSYLAAEFMANSDSAQQNIPMTWDDDQWKEAILDCCSLSLATSVCAELERIPDSLFCRRLLFQAECLSKQPASQPSVAGDNVETALFELATKSRFTHLQKVAAEALAYLGSDSAATSVSQLIARLEGDEANRAVRLFSYSSSASYHDALLAEYYDSHDIRRLCEVIVALAVHYDEETEKLLFHILSTAAAPDLRSRAAEVLGGWGSDAAGPILLKALESDTDADVRRKAAEGLLNTTLDMEPSRIADLLLRDNDRLVRAHLGRLLRRHISQYVPLLIKVLDVSTDSIARSRAAEALSGIDDRRVARSLRVALFNDLDCDVRESCARSLSGSRDPEILTSLLRAVQLDTSSAVRVAAIETVVAIGGSSVACVLIDVAGNDSDYAVRASALRGIGTLPAADVYQFAQNLSSLLLDISHPEDLREACVQAYARVRSAEATNIVVDRLLKDPSWRVRSRCALSLASRLSKNVNASLVHAIQLDPDKTVRAWAINALRTADDETCWDAIRHAAEADPELFVRWTGIASLRSQLTDKSVALLRSIIVNNNEPINLRELAVQSLAEMPAADVMPEFMRLLQDPTFDCSNPVFEAAFRLNVSLRHAAVTQMMLPVHNLRSLKGVTHDV